MIIDSSEFNWSDQAWGGLTSHGQVVYEMHIGTFTPEGTWQAAARELPELAEVGNHGGRIDAGGRLSRRVRLGLRRCIPVRADATLRHAGRFPPFRRPGACVGIGVILDVVYNHFGPDGNYLQVFADAYFTGQVRERVGRSDQFRRPRLRSGARVLHRQRRILDRRISSGRPAPRRHASIFDARRRTSWRRSAGASREAARGAPTIVVAENEPQDASLRAARRKQGGYGLDGLWNDDFHHLPRSRSPVATRPTTPIIAASPQEFISAMKHGFLYQGQRYEWQQKRRGTPAHRHRAGTAFITYLQNHDQVANSVQGLRMHELTKPGAVPGDDGVAAACGRKRRCFFKVRNSLPPRRSVTLSTSPRTG